MSEETVGTLVVGGGLNGAGIAYYLAKAGETDVHLVEGDLYGAGATNGSMGNIRQQFGTAIEIECSRRGLHFWKNVEEILGFPAPFHEDGFLMITDSEQNKGLLEEHAELQKSLDMPDVHILTPGEIADVVPFLNVEGLVCGSYTPHDGHVIPTDGMNAFISAGRELGVKYRQHWKAEEIVRDGSQWSVRGPSAIKAEKVIVAAGAGTKDLLAPFGIDLSIRAVPHLNLLSEPAFPGQRIPTVIDIDHGMTVERDGPGLIFAMTGRNPAPSNHDELAEMFMAQAERRAPALTDVGIAMRLRWFPTVGGDDQPYIGQVDDNFWTLAFTGHGAMHGPPLAEAVAAMAMGKPDDSLDLSIWDPRRTPGKPNVLWRRNRQD
jgi:sarcosine oxidase, subunit beta